MTDAPFRAVHPEKLVVNFNKNLESSGKYRDSFYSVLRILLSSLLQIEAQLPHHKSRIIFVTG